jgi:hypothetical protein
LDGTRRLIDNRYAIDTTGLDPLLPHFFVRRIWRGKPKQNCEGLDVPRPKPVPEFRLMSVLEILECWRRLEGHASRKVTEMPRHEPRDPTAAVLVEWTE